MNYKPSDITQGYMKQIVNMTLYSLILTKKGLKEHDYGAFDKILGMKKEYKELMDKFMKRKAERLVQADEDYIDKVRIETTLVDNFYHIYHLNRLVAKQWMKESKEQEAVLNES